MDYNLLYLFPNMKDVSEIFKIANPDVKTLGNYSHISPSLCII